RFRILVVGRANAGKTTILQRLCNTTDQPEVFDGEGRYVECTVIPCALSMWLARGHHNIEYEMVFKSNPHFVFHDSCGFESGSEAQFEKMREFVMDCAKTPKLEKRIHAIWFCIPLNECHRMVLAAERKFFNECGTGHVPVIVLLTKADTLELDAIQEIEGLQLEIGEADRRIRVAEIQGRMVDENLAKVKKWLNDNTGMQQEGADFTSLLKCTANALNEESQQKLLISTQQSGLALCIEFAVMK
ncbi:GTP-binding protein, partial [Pisolithus orientalis]|uniref:GTP-binding protein n=1 Tax=Pisolithus orientalis TaxID=936130 RepID=UPI0022257382